MSSSVDKIKERLSIVDVISSYLTVEQSGRNYKAKCPFHNEKTPSFFISPDRGSYYCFGCGVKGDIFSFVEHFEGTDFVGSLKLLADRAGVVLEYNNNPSAKSEKDRYYEIMEEATLFFESNYYTCDEARAYLHSRGLTDETIKLFRIGYAEDAWQSLFNYLTKKGYKKEDIETVGLIKNKESRYYDRFRSRIMFPISDSSGRVIAFSGRIFGVNKSDKEEAKYLNSPDTPLFNKSNVLFGIDKAKIAIKTRGYSIIVEGQMDLLMSHQASFTNTVAVSGTAFTDSTTDNESKINNLGLVKRLSPNIIFAYDGDSAGVRAASRSAMIALSLDMQVKVAILEEGKDPADIILEDSDKWKDIIKNSVNIVSFHLDRICKNTNDLRIRGKQVRDIIFPFLRVTKSAIEKSAYINEIYQKTNIPTKAIVEDFENYEKANPVNENKVIDIKNDKNIKIEINRKDELARRLMRAILWQEKQEDKVLDLKKINTLIEEKIGRDALMQMREVHEPYSEILYFEAEKWYGDKSKDIGREIEEIILNLEEEILNERKEELSNTEDSDEKWIEFSNLSKRIEEIKRNRSL